MEMFSRTVYCMRRKNPLESKQDTHAAVEAQGPSQPVRWKPFLSGTPSILGYKHLFPGLFVNENTGGAGGKEESFSKALERNYILYDKNHEG